MKNAFIIFLLVGSIVFIPMQKAQAEPLSEKISKQRIKELVPVVNQEIRKLILKGKVLLQKGELNKAMALFSRALQEVPYHPLPYFFLAKTYFLLGQDAKAFAVLEQAGRSQTDSDIIFDLLFETQSLLKKEVPLREEKVFIAPFKDNKQMAMSFSFDDGALNVYTDVLPMFEKFGYRATIPINPKIITEKVTNPWWGSWEQWRDAQARGFEISNHAMEHHDLTQVDVQKLDYYINDSFDLIQKKLGKAPMSFVFPQDKANKEILLKVFERHIAMRQRDALSQVYKNIFIPVYGGQFFSEKTAERIIDLGLLKRLWVIAECHAIATKDIKTYKPMTKELLEKHLTYIKGKEDKIWVDTFINVYLYLIEKKRSQLYWESISSHQVKLFIKAQLNPKIFHKPLTIVIDTSPVYPKKALAVQERSLKKLSVKIRGNKLYIDVIPNTSPVEVIWQ